MVSSAARRLSAPNVTSPSGRSLSLKSVAGRLYLKGSSGVSLAAAEDSDLKIHRADTVSVAGNKVRLSGEEIRLKLKDARASGESGPMAVCACPGGKVVKNSFRSKQKF